MKRAVWCWLLGLCLLGGVGHLSGAGPDDDYLRIYALLQQGDLLLQNGRTGDAQLRYREALQRLLEFEKAYPGWNDALIRFRKQYLLERVGAAAPAAPATTAPAAPAAPTDPRHAALEEEIKRLSAERDHLQARLREALVAQPAAVDPRELARAEERLAAARREIEQLRAEIVARDARLAEAGEARQLAQQLAEARQALTEARQQLDRQNQTVRTLQQQVAELQRRLEQSPLPAAAPAELTQARAELEAARRQAEALRARTVDLERQLAARPPATDEAEVARARRELEHLRRQNTEALQRVADLESRLEAARQANAALERRLAERPVTPPAPAPQSEDAAAARQLSALRERLEKLQQELATERWRAENFRAEKEVLEKRVAELSAAPAPAAAVSPANAPEPSAPSRREEKALAKYQREADKVRIRQLERDRKELNKRLRVLTRQLEDLRRQAAGGTNAVTDQLAILRARLEAYESRAVPYTPEELALFKSTPRLSGGTNRAETASNRRALRQIPAGAASLLSDAQRAFQLRRYDEAERKLHQALQLDERNVDMLTYLAAAQLEQNRLAEAEATLQRALAVDAEDANAVSLLGLLRYRQGRYEEALDVLSRAAQLNPDDPNVQNYLGVTLIQRGQRAAAENALRRAVALDPGHGEAHANLAALYAQARPPFRELARFHYQKALSLGQPRDPALERLLESAPDAAPAAP